jgi:hypothetical protein
LRRFPSNPEHSLRRFSIAIGRKLARHILARLRERCATFARSVPLLGPLARVGRAIGPSPNGMRRNPEIVGDFDRGRAVGDEIASTCHLRIAA